MGGSGGMEQFGLWLVVAWMALVLATVVVLYVWARERTSQRSREGEAGQLGT